MSSRFLIQSPQKTFRTTTFLRIDAGEYCCWRRCASPVQQKPLSKKHTSSSVGARSSSAAPGQLNPLSKKHTNLLWQSFERPTEELALRESASVRRGRPRTAALRLKRFRVFRERASVHRGGQKVAEKQEVVCLLHRFVADCVVE